jgi:ectoine hydroxylase-related dioxygenase (phytanoyl-CoA dioxygenase family)
MNNPLTAREHAETMRDYVNDGVTKAKSLGNRGPLNLGSNGKLTNDILEAFDRTGFYVFENVIDPAEIALLRQDMDWLLDRAPTDNGAATDHQGRPAYGQRFARPVYSMIQPLADPWGGTQALNGRHPTQMDQPVAADQPPHKVVFIMTGMCQTMPSGLRLYGHPDLLAVAASINGDDFVPYNDAIFIKQPGRGGSVSWHQDGVTHWGNPKWDSGIHGFNFQVQLYDTTARSCLWVVPGTHKEGKIDIKARVAANQGSERLADAVPLFCNAGDVTIVNRQALHGSFANTSKDLRISLTFGFHRHSSVLGAAGALSESEAVVYDEARIATRSEVVGVAIDARAQFYPDEERFLYQPLVGQEEALRFNDANWQRVIKDYNLNDLSI